MTNPMPSEPIQPGAADRAGSVASGRVGSIDAYRGFVMFLMMAEVLQLSRVAHTAGTITGRYSAGLLKRRVWW